MDKEEKLRNELLESLGHHAERSYGFIPVHAPTRAGKTEAPAAAKPEVLEVTGMDAGHLGMKIGNDKLGELEREASRLIGGRYVELKREESTLLAVLDDGKRRLMQQEGELLRSRLDELEESTDNLMRQFGGGKPRVHASSIEAKKERLRREVEEELRRKLAELERETSGLMRQMELEFQSAIRQDGVNSSAPGVFWPFDIGSPQAADTPLTRNIVRPSINVNPRKGTGFPSPKGSRPEIKAAGLEKQAMTMEVPAKAGFDGMLGRLFSHAGSTASRGEIYEVGNKLEKLFANVARAQVELGLQRDLIGRAEEREGRMLESISELRSMALRNELALMAMKAKICGQDA